MAKFNDLDGKIAVVTGSARGIGFESAKLLAEHGATAIITDINLEGAKASAKELTDMGLKADAFFLDVADPENILKTIEEIGTKYKTIDILVNNAGILSPYNVGNLSLENWNRVIDIDLRGTHLCSQAAMKYMIAQRSGKIVNVASMAGEVGALKAGPDYGAAKAGAINLAKCYARYLAEYNVNSNSVAPGFIETEMTRGRGDTGDEVPMKRLGTALDIAKAVYFLSSDLSDYITGANISVNGGLQMLG